MHKPECIIENETHKGICDFQIQIDFEKRLEELKLE